MDIKTVADLLGHSSISITGHVYGITSDNTAQTTAEVERDVNHLLRPVKLSSKRANTLEADGSQTATVGEAFKLSPAGERSHVHH